MRAASFWIAVGLLVAPVAAHGDDFKCPDGAKDSGARPNQVVRWCEIQKDGRPVYHGPVWRWHRNGQLEGHEYYVNGNAEGEWPSWYENGKPSSRGSFKSGQKAGLWKYWAKDGHLTSEVTYSAAGAASVQYSPSGRKMATGTFKEGAKVGLWIAFNDDGTERARCDFGEGLFALPANNGCQVIAREVEPKGFSRPVPNATVTENGKAVIRVGPQTFTFKTPPGWTADAKAGEQDGATVVFFPAGTGWRQAGRNIYIRPCFKEGRPLQAVMEAEREEFASNVAEYNEAPLKTGKLSNGREFVAKKITYKPVMQTDSPFSVVQDNTISEAVGYVDASPEVVLMVVLACDEQEQMKAALPSLFRLTESFGIPARKGE